MPALLLFALLLRFDASHWVFKTRSPKVWSVPQLEFVAKWFLLQHALVELVVVAGSC
jgi:hypothetical protein